MTEEKEIISIREEIRRKVMAALDEDRFEEDKKYYIQLPV